MVAVNNTTGNMDKNWKRKREEVGGGGGGG